MKLMIITIGASFALLALLAVWALCRAAALADQRARTLGQVLAEREKERQVSLDAEAKAMRGYKLDLPNRAEGMEKP